MLKKLFAIFTLAVLAIGSAAAQSAVGSWNMFPVFSGKIDQVVDARHKVYFTSSNRLFSYDKESDEMYAWSIANHLNDNNVSGIYYNPDGGYVVLTYDNGNIDVVDDADGRVHNLSDIKAASLNSSKTINHVTFGKGRIHVATDFGFVTFDDKRFEVKESGIFNEKINYIAESNGLLIVQTGARLLASPIDVRHNTLDKFDEVSTSLSLGDLQPINGGALVYSPYQKSLYRMLIDPETRKCTAFDNLNLDPTQMPRLNDAGQYVAVVDNNIVTLDMDANVLATTAIPEALAGQTIAMSKGLASLWAANKDGIANYSIADGSALTVLRDKMMPVGTLATAIPVYLEKNNDGSRIFVANKVSYDMFVGAAGDFLTPATVDVFENGEPFNVSPVDVPYKVKNNINRQTQAGSTSVLRPNGFSVDPTHANRYAIASYFEAIVVVEDGVVKHFFDKNNAPFNAWWDGGVTSGVKFDSKGNLWLVQFIAWAADEPVAMLPAAKVNGPADQVTKADWLITEGARSVFPGGTHMDAVMFFPSKAPQYGFFSCVYKLVNQLAVIDTKTNKMSVVSPLIDQDGKSMAFGAITCMAEDQRGRVWVGTPNGVFEITNPAEVMNADFRVNHIKVPRNDGTNFADYLLDSEKVYSIAVDGSNRKWIATANSGLYLVSENGDQILANYNTDNSDIPSNTVFSVACDPNSNIVYVGTLNGLCTFGSTSSPAAENYNDVYAFPNPVRPEYKGYITVRGLMDNSLVKIADSAGNVVHQGRSQGGMYVWDGNNASGNRVSSGVYYVFASQNANDNASGAVTKIVVIN